MKKCNNCGSSMPDDVSVCLECGADLITSRTAGTGGSTGTQGQQNDNEQIVNYQTVYVQQPVKAAPDAMGKAVASLVIGLVGLFISIFAPVLEGIPAIFGLILCIVGIVIGAKARNKIPAGVSGRGIATAGFVSSIIGAIISGIMTLVVICVVVGFVAICASSSASPTYYIALLFPFI